MSSENPYAASHVRSTVVPDSPLQLGPGADRGLVNQVTVLAILMIVQGAFELIYGAFMAVAAAFIPAMMQAQMEAEGENIGQMRLFMLVVYGVMGAVSFITGGMHIYGGIRIYRFQNRILGLVALAVGILDIGNCYCLPTAFALGIYGLIVLVNAPVVTAFEFAKRGHSRDEIIRSFNQL